MIARNTVANGAQIFEPDRALAIRYFEQAHKQFHQASYELGLMFYLDPRNTALPDEEAHFATYGVHPDKERAAYYFFIAARKGSKSASVNLAEMLIAGTIHPPTTVDEEEPTTHPGDTPSDIFADARVGREDGITGKGARPQRPRKVVKFFPRTRHQTLHFARHILGDLYDPVKKRWDPKFVPLKSPVQDLLRLIAEEEELIPLRDRPIDETRPPPRSDERPYDRENGGQQDQPGFAFSGSETEMPGMEFSEHEDYSEDVIRRSSRRQSRQSRQKW